MESKHATARSSCSEGREIIGLGRRSPRSSRALVRSTYVCVGNAISITIDEIPVIKDTEEIEMVRSGGGGEDKCGVVV